VARLSAPENPKKQRQIVETARSLFMRYGVKRVTVEEICRKANVSKMTFYRYFADKTELFKYILNSWFEEAQNRANEIIAGNRPFAEELELIFRWKLELMAKMSDEFIREILDFDPEVKEFMEDYYRRSYKFFLDLVVRWQRKGAVRPGIRPELLIAIFNKYQELLADNELRRVYPDHSGFIKELHEILFYGIATRSEPGRS